MPGTSSLAGSRGLDGIDFCFIFNTRNWPPGSSASPPEDLAATINSLLDGIDGSTRPLPSRTGGQPLRDNGEALVRRRRAQHSGFGGALKK